MEDVIYFIGMIKFLRLFLFPRNCAINLKVIYFLVLSQQLANRLELVSVFLDFRAVSTHIRDSVFGIELKFSVPCGGVSS